MNIRPNRQMRFYLAALPFVLLAIAYFAGSSIRLTENPNDKLLPALPTMVQAVRHMAFEVDVRTGTILMLSDTIASLGRLASALAISTAAALVFGIVLGLSRQCAASTVGVIDGAPLALLPILFIVMGLGESSDALIDQTLPCIIRGLTMKVLELPREQFIKGADAGRIDTGGGAARRLQLPRLIELLRLQPGRRLFPCRRPSPPILARPSHLPGAALSRVDVIIPYVI